MKKAKSFLNAGLDKAIIRSRKGLLIMSTITTISPAAASPPLASSTAKSNLPSVKQSATDMGTSTHITLNGNAEASTKDLVWENRTRSTSATIMAGNFAIDSIPGRLHGLGSELLKQVAYDGADFSQSVQQAPLGIARPTYDMLVSPTKVSQHGMGDNQISLSVTTVSGVKVDFRLDAGSNSIAVEAHANGKLNDLERKALGKLSEGFQKAIDGLTEDNPRFDLADLAQFDHRMLSSVDFKSQIKTDTQNSQRLELHADNTHRILNFSGHAGSAKIDIDLSQPASWGDKQQQAKALDHYLQQVDQASLRGQGNSAIINQFKEAFSALNHDYGSRPIAQHALTLNRQDHAIVSGLADFSASFSQADTSPNPARVTETDSFSYQLEQKTTITGSSQDDRSISQQQSAHLKARFHAPVNTTAALALDLSPSSQNYSYVTIDDAATSYTSISYEHGLLAKAELNMQASQNTRTLRYAQGKLQNDRSTPLSNHTTLDLIGILEPERIGLAPLSDTEQSKMLESLNDRILLRQNPDALSGRPVAK